MAATFLSDAVRKHRELRERGIGVQSAGTSATAGDPATQLSVGVMKAFDLDLKGHQASRLTPDLVNWTD